MHNDTGVVNRHISKHLTNQASTQQQLQARHANSEIPSQLKTAINQLWVFGDSYSDFGTVSSYLWKNLVWQEDSEAWSGTTYSDQSLNWQTILRQRYGLISGDKSQSIGLLDTKELQSGITNSFSGYSNGDPNHVPSNPSNPSFAYGGALSNTKTLVQITNPLEAGPEANKGVQAQIDHAIQSKAPFQSDDLVVAWSGANDLLAGRAKGSQVGFTKELLKNTLQRILKRSKRNITALIRSGGARSLFAATLVPTQGIVQGKKYQMPFIETINPTWKELFSDGIIKDHQEKFATMLTSIRSAYPHVSIIYFNPEFEVNWQKFDENLGDFSSYGITNTTKSSILNWIPAEESLYLGPVHPTAQGHKMLAKAIELTIADSATELEAVAITNTQTAEDNTSQASAKGVYRRSPSTKLKGGAKNDLLIGTAKDNRLVGRKGNDILKTSFGKDVLKGGQGRDFLEAGFGKDILAGGPGADFFNFKLYHSDGKVNRIRDFKPEQEGDRLGLSSAYAESVNNLFLMPTQKDWQKIIQIEPHNKQSTMLMVNFQNHGEKPMKILLDNIDPGTFNLDWIS